MDRNGCRVVRIVMNIIIGNSSNTIRHKYNHSPPTMGKYLAD